MGALAFSNSGDHPLKRIPFTPRSYFTLHFLTCINMFHPFNSWSEAGNGQSGSNALDGVAQSPTVFGALPYPSDPNYSSMISFYFTSFNPNILNCSVVGPRAQTYYRIVTDDQMPGYTIIKNGEGRNVSLVEWQTHPMIEVRGILSKQHVRTWLGLTNDRRSVLL